MHPRPKQGTPTQLSDLPIEVVILILEKITGEFDDILSCAGVCISWRSIIGSLYRRLKRSKPFMILREKTSLSEKDPPAQQSLYLFDTVTNKSHVIHLPQLSKQWVHGCSNGWLLTIASEFPHMTRFLNPVSQSEVMLPSLGSEFERSIRVITSSRDPSDLHCVVLSAVLRKRPHVSRHGLLFCHPRTEAWKKVMFDVEEVDGIIWQDIILHNNQFYGVSNKFLYRISFDGQAQNWIPLPPYQEAANTPPPIRTSFFLVEFNGELVLVAKRIYKGLFIRLKIYKLKCDGQKIWIEMEDLGGNVIYLGAAHSVAVTVKECFNNSVVLFAAGMPYGIALKNMGHPTMNFYRNPESTKPIQWFTL